MLKTATITWNSFYNFGTCLQAFALQKFIESMGCSNKIIDDSTIVAPLAVQTSLWQRIVFKCTYYVTKIVRLFSPKYNAFYKMQRVLIQKTNSFKRDMLNIDYNICSVINDETDYDLFICGSDQVWNPMVLEDNRRLFYYCLSLYCYYIINNSKGQIFINGELYFLRFLFRGSYYFEIFISWGVVSRPVCLV